MKFNLIIVLVIVMFKTEATLSTITFGNQPNTLFSSGRYLKYCHTPLSLGLPVPDAILAVAMLSSSA